jgi:D-xylono/L-arabinono-1,4-lactonase
MAGERAELVAPLKCMTAENPLWCAERETLFFTDIPSGTIYGYRPSQNQCDVVARTRVTGGFTLQEDGSLLLFQDGPIAVLERDGSVRQVASNACPENERFNDVIADPEGRVFAGAMGGNGRLLRFDTDGRATELFDGVGIANGMGFTLDLRGMYFTDSVARQVYYFDYDRATGNLSNRRVFAEIPSEVGLPDGMTVDSEGFVWSAIWYGGRLRRYAPDGRLDREVFLPATQTSSATFGGGAVDEIYVTSAAKTEDDPLRPRDYDLTAWRGGGLYHVRVEGIKGRLPFRSRVKFPGASK